MNLYEQSCVSKVFLAAMGIINRQSITKVELEVTFKALENFAEHNQYWNNYQKDYYKLLIKFVKELMKDHSNE